MSDPAQPPLPIYIYNMTNEDDEFKVGFYYSFDSSELDKEVFLTGPFGDEEAALAAARAYIVAADTDLREAA